MSEAIASSYARAVGAYRCGMYDRAQKLCQDLLADSPTDLNVLHLLSIIAYAKGDSELEFKYLNRILDIDPNHPEALNGLASVYRVRGKSAEAIPLCLRAIQVRPDYAIAHNTLGLCYQEGGSSSQASECFKNAIALRPDLPGPHLNLGSALQALGKPEEAAACFRTAAALAPNSIEAHESLGFLLLQERKREEAVVCFQRALELKPNSVKLLLQLAEAKAQIGLSEECVSLVRRALELDPKSGRAYCLLGTRVQDLGDFQAAAAAFERSIEFEPVQGEAYLGLFIGRKATVKDSGLLEQMTRNLSDKSLSLRERMQLCTALGKIYDDLGDYEKAVNCMDESNRIAMNEVRSDEANRFLEGLSQYVDWLMKTITPSFFEDHASSRVSSDLPILIVGLPRSGTTLMEQIVSRHPQVAAGGELTFWWDQHTQTPQGLGGLTSQPKDAAALADRYLSLLKSYGPAAQFVTDKMPDNFFQIGFIHLLFPNARFIHCRRDPLDNCVSLYMTPFRTRPPFTHRREDILTYYRLYEKLAEHWRLVIPKDRMLEVEYERVIRDRETETRRILDFCGLDWDEACMTPEDNKRVVNTPSKWQTRQAVYTTSVERWRRYEPWLGALQELRT